MKFLMIIWAIYLSHVLLPGCPVVPEQRLLHTQEIGSAQGLCCKLHPLAPRNQTGHQCVRGLLVSPELVDDMPSTLVRTVEGVCNPHIPQYSFPIPFPLHISV